MVLVMATPLAGMNLWCGPGPLKNACIVRGTRTGRRPARHLPTCAPSETPVHVEVLLLDHDHLCEYTFLLSSRLSQGPIWFGHFIVVKTRLPNTIQDTEHTPQQAKASSSFAASTVRPLRVFNSATLHFQRRGAPTKVGEHEIPLKKAPSFSTGASCLCYLHQRRTANHGARIHAKPRTERKLGLPHKSKKLHRKSQHTRTGLTLAIDALPTWRTRRDRSHSETAVEVTKPSCTSCTSFVACCLTAWFHSAQIFVCRLRRRRSRVLSGSSADPPGQEDLESTIES